MNKLPPSEISILHSLELDLVSPDQLKQMYRVLEVVNESVVGGCVVFKDNHHKIAYVITTGDTAIVDLRYIHCSCMDDNKKYIFQSDVNNITGMCYHLVKAVASKINIKVNFEYKDIMGYFIRHAGCNTYEDIPELREIGRISYKEKKIVFLDNGRFLYATTDTECESYYWKGMKWCSSFENSMDESTKNYAEKWIKNKYFVEIERIKNTNEKELESELLKGINKFTFFGDAVEKNENNDHLFDKNHFSFDSKHYRFFIDAEHYEPERNIVHFRVGLAENVLKTENETFSGMLYRDELRIKLPTKYQSKYSNLIKNWIIMNDKLFLHVYESTRSIVNANAKAVKLANDKKKKSLLLKKRMNLQKTNKYTLIDGYVSFGMTNKKGELYYYLKLVQIVDETKKETKRQKKVINKTLPMEWIKATHFELFDMQKIKPSKKYSFKWTQKDIRNIFIAKYNGPN